MKEAFLKALLSAGMAGLLCLSGSAGGRLPGFGGPDLRLLRRHHADFAEQPAVRGCAAQHQAHDPGLLQRRGPGHQRQV